MKMIALLGVLVLAWLSGAADAQQITVDVPKAAANVSDYVARYGNQGCMDFREVQPPVMAKVCVKTDGEMTILTDSHLGTATDCSVTYILRGAGSEKKLYWDPIQCRSGSVDLQMYAAIVALFADRLINLDIRVTQMREKSI